MYFFYKNIDKRRIPIKSRFPIKRSEVVIGSIIAVKVKYNHDYVQFKCIVTEIVPLFNVNLFKILFKGLSSYRLKVLDLTENSYHFRFDKNVIRCIDFLEKFPIYNICTMSEMTRKEYILDYPSASLKMFVKKVRNHIRYSPNTKFGKELCHQGQQKLNELKIKNV